MRTVIVDDETRSRQTICNFIEKYAPHLEVIGQADGVENAIEMIDELQPQLVFLDIQMGDGTGFDVLGRVKFNQFKLIFCTSFDNYAIKAFRYSAIDYILKPIDPDIFVSAIRKIETEPRNPLAPRLDVLNNNKSGFSRIALHSVDGISLIKVSDIIRCESDVNYTRFYIANSPVIVVPKTLKEYDEMLTDHGFIRVHKSHLVNIDYIRKYIKGDGGWVIMADDSKIEVSRRKKDNLMEILEKL